MRLAGKRIYLANHRSENLEQLFRWSQDKNLIAIEMGDPNKIVTNITLYSKNIFQSYLENNPDVNNNFCHFGIYKNTNKDLLGYADLQNIDEENLSAELSISIPEIKHRNKGYGFEAFLLVLDFCFNNKKLKTLCLRTLKTNHHVFEMGKKLNIPFQEKIITKQKQNYELYEFAIDTNCYKKIRDNYKFLFSV